MIAWAPLTRLTNWLSSDKGRRDLGVRIPSALGLAALEVARAEIGQGETTGQNAGPRLDVYRGSLGGSGAWCAAFTYYCYLVAISVKIVAA